MGKRSVDYQYSTKCLSNSLGAIKFQERVNTGMLEIRFVYLNMREVLSLGLYLICLKHCVINFGESLELIIHYEQTSCEIKIVKNKFLIWSNGLEGGGSQLWKNMLMNIFYANSTICGGTCDQG